MATTTDTVDLDLAHTVRLLHDAEREGRMVEAAMCWVRIDVLLDRRLAARVTVPA